MTSEERRCLEGTVYGLMYLFAFLLTLPVLIRFMESAWSKWLYTGIAVAGLILLGRLRLLLGRVR